MYLGLSLLDKAIQNQVSEHYEDLLKHASGIETLENVLSMMHNHIQVDFIFFILLLTCC